ncbi:MAG: ribonuclease H family protein [Campylobacterota bacterium]|nr:ribonuclease H family protein [Campylobacterota bacterium]
MTIRVDENFIQLGMQGDELNKAQLEMLGESYPPSEGWESRSIGKELNTPQGNLFLLLRGKLALKAQEQIIKNYQLLAEFHKNKNQTKSDTPAPKEKQPSQVATGRLTIYCDGACKGNPGKAGSGVAIYTDNTKPTLLYGEYNPRGTNNTAELGALYKALLIVSQSNTTKAMICCDSKYSIDCITNWAYGWKRKGWVKKGGEIKNLEIIQTAHALYDEIKDRVIVKHVKGHSGVEGNELADRMAVYAISSQSSEYQEYDYGSVDSVLRMNEG